MVTPSEGVLRSEGSTHSRGKACTHAEHRRQSPPHPPDSEFARKSVAEALVIDREASSNLRRSERLERRMWRVVSRSPFESLWNLRGVSARVVAVRTWKALLADRVFAHAAELGFYFIFAIFPALFCASSTLGLVAKSAHRIYDQILNYLALVVPAEALKTVLFTFNQTTAAASSGKVTLGSVATIWTASVGISAIRDALNAIYKIKDSRSYVVTQIYAVWLTFLLGVVITIGLAALFAGNFAAVLAHSYFHARALGIAAALIAHILAWTIAAIMLTLSTAIVYYWAPGWETRRWQWLTPGGAAAILGWLIASLGLRIYLVLFNRFSVVYGSLGAVIILLTWLYICGFMLLLGAEINKEIEVAAVRKRAEEDVSSTGA